MEEDTLVSDIVAQAFREGNFTAVGEAITDDEMGEGVVRLRNIISAVFGFELGELLRDWYVPQEPDPEAPLGRLATSTGERATSTLLYTYPPSNSRLLVKLTTESTLYFPANPSDGARMSYIDVGTPTDVDVTLDGNGRWIEGASSLVSDADAITPVTFHGRKWLYRADRAEWVRLTQITADGTVPTPPEFDMLWITGLCVMMAPRYQVAIQPQIAQAFSDMVTRLKARYKQSESYPGSYEARRLLRESGI